MAVECVMSSHACLNITCRRTLLDRVSSTLAYYWLSNATLPYSGTVVLCNKVMYFVILWSLLLALAVKLYLSPYQDSR